MERRDRLANVLLLAAAVGAWAAVALLVTSRSPTGDPGIQLAGALLIGLAVGLTLWPLCWLAVFAMHRRVAYRGDWGRAARRALLGGSVVAILVLLRASGTFSWPLAIFVIAMALLMEVLLTVRR